MRFMMMMHAPAGNGEYKLNDWSPEDFKRHIEFMHTFNRQIQATGERIGAEGLAPPGQAKLVKAANDGTPITDGVFPESKEFLVGYWIIEVESLERACELAAQVSVAPGPGGEPLHMNLELRQVMSAPPTDA